MGNAPGCPGCKSKDGEADAPGEETPVRTGEDPIQPTSLSPRNEADAGTDAAEEKPEPWKLPKGGRLTVMMFGMTGAGKSSLGNLIAGFDAFESGDDTASVTNLDSVMRYEAQDDSLVLLDTIGLGDTEIDQEKVVASIRDVALSAPNGVDVLFFVMRNTRITDDAIARLIYVTEYLWGSECLLNLYVVVTCASRYLNNRDDAIAWIERQVEINWRFRHVYRIVGENPNRFVFIDNPDPKSEEPGWEARQAASRAAIMRALYLHPLAAVPPFTFRTMERAQEVAKKHEAELMEKRRKVQEKQEQLQKTRRRPMRRSTTAGCIVKGSVGPAPKRQASCGVLRLEGAQPEDLERELAEAKKDQLAAEKAMRQALASVRADRRLQAEAAKEVEAATASFGQRYAETASIGSGDVSDSGEKLSQACRRMMGSLMPKAGGKKLRFGRGRSTTSVDRGAGVQEQRPAPAPAPCHGESWESVLNEILAHVKSVLQGPPEEVFGRLDTARAGAISPVAFSSFMRTTKPGIRSLHVGGLWRRADANCDGQLDLGEFCALLGADAGGRGGPGQQAAAEGTGAPKK
mmetsp:Transcript_45607/g.145529  ORF Transcript_45607/g.145529 Transcript_45607/m.145529 type:complete len:575 (-) Transcript_45607:116-1840(-)